MVLIVFGRVWHFRLDRVSALDGRTASSILFEAREKLCGNQENPETQECSKSNEELLEKCYSTNLAKFVFTS